MPGTQLQGLRHRVNRLLMEHTLAVKQVKQERSRLRQAKKKVITAEAAQKILQQVAQAVQNRVHEKIAGIVTTCLRTIFEKPYVFKIKFEKSRGKTEARFVLVTNKQEIDPTEAEGGGVLDVIAFALRLAALILHKPPLRRVLLLDEPFKFVSPDNRHKIADLIQQLSQELKVQFIIVTHDEELVIGKVVKIV